MHFLAILVALTLTVPPAVKVIAVSAFVYGLIQALKQAPLLKPYLKNNYVQIALNVALNIAGVLAVTPADQLYTLDTLMKILQSFTAAAGIHGTIQAIITQAREGKTNALPQDSTNP